MWNPRMQWICQRIFETFEPQVTLNEVGEFVSNPNVRKHFEDLLSSKETTKVFVHFQVEAEVGATAGGENSNDGKPKLIVSIGNSIPIKSKCCYFLRTTPDGKAIDVQKSSDNTLCFGELAPNILRDLESTIASLFTPIIKAKEDWGKADNELKNEFMVESEKFANDLKEALNSMDSGLELRRPNRDIDGSNSINRSTQSDSSPALIAHYEEVLHEWCEVISSYLDTNTTTSKEEPIDDDGPMGELEYWRRRMQRLTSIMEQLKLSEFKEVFTLLSRTLKNVNEETKQRIQLLLRRWKQIDIGITEATNEAKDNVK
jgi:dynein heavy chain